MKTTSLLITALLSLLISAPTFAQPQPGTVTVTSPSVNSPADVTLQQPSVKLTPLDGGVYASVTTGLVLPVPGALPDPNDLGAVIGVLFAAAHAGHWAFLVSFAVLALVYLARKVIPDTTSAGALMNSKLGKLVTNFLTSGLLSAAAAFYVGQPLGWPVVAGALGVAVMASGGWTIGKNFLEALQELKVSKAAVAQAAAVVPGSSSDPLNK